MVDALILGGGLAGSAAACLIARGGKSVNLLERAASPHHKVCGEFLSVEATRHLRQLGIDPVTLGAVPINRIRVVRGSHEVEAKLPFTAFGLSRFTLDEALIEKAEAYGAHIERGVRVLELNGHVARTTQGERKGSQVLLATGKLPIRVEGQMLSNPAIDGFVGFKMHYRLAAAATEALAGTIILNLFKGGYLGLQLVESGRANLCLIVRRKALLQLGGEWQALCEWFNKNSILQRILDDAQPLFEKPVTIANLTYGPPVGGPAFGVALGMGDRWAMTPSLTGDGMAIALRSAFLAAHCVLSDNNAKSYHDLMAAQTRRQLTWAMIIQKWLEVPKLQFTAHWLARLHPPLITYATSATRLPDWNNASGDA
jgi:flavin-dependent dehydrogenase